jgi:hypothetical protein
MLLRDFAILNYFDRLDLFNIEEYITPFGTIYIIRPYARA